VTRPTTSCATSNGGDVRVSLHLAEPPASSYVEMRIDAELYDNPTVLTVDGDLFLIHTVVSIRDPPPCSYQDKFFVYRAAAHPVTPLSLRLLPHFGDQAAHARHTGIISCRGGEEFVMATFHTSIVRGEDEGASFNDESVRWDEVGVLSRFSSSTGRREVKELPIPFDPDRGLYPFTWTTNKVFSFRGFMCWVDYHRDILYCDVAFSDLPELWFVQLPGIEIWGDSHDYYNGCHMPVA
jgi:hypothetical protein